MLSLKAAATFTVVSVFTKGFPSLSPPGQKPIRMMGLLAEIASGIFALIIETILPAAW